MDCSEVLIQVELYLDQEMTDVNCEEFKQHLGDCSPCMDRAEFQQSLRLIIAKKCKCEDIPADLAQKILASLDAEESTAP